MPLLNISEPPLLPLRPKDPKAFPENRLKGIRLPQTHLFDQPGPELKLIPALGDGLYISLV